MTLEELITQIETRQTESAGQWTAAIAADPATTRVVEINGAAATTDLLYEAAVLFLQMDPSRPDLARVQLEGIRFQENQRGGASAVVAALASLDTYEDEL